MTDEDSGRRICKWPGCGTRLSQYNKDEYCSVHMEAARQLRVKEEDRMPCEKDDKRPMTVGEVAQRLGYSERAVREMLNNGEIDGSRVRPKGKWLIDEAEVDRLLRDAKKETDSADRAKSGLSAKTPTSIEDLEEKYGGPFIVPERLRFLFPGYISGQRVSTDMKPLTPSMQSWNRLLPSEQEMVHDILRCLGIDPRDFDKKMRSLAPPGGTGPMKLTYKPPGRA